MTAVNRFKIKQNQNIIHFCNCFITQVDIPKFGEFNYQTTKEMEVKKTCPHIKMVHLGIYAWST